MGVQGLWTLVSPAARPVKLESLRDRKLAIDASIWIHQFMRTMRSEDGSVLRNGHTLGFFRRICKLLFYNIKPVFVFDGGAPTLKRSTIRERRKRRQGIQENVKRTAEKILKAQMKAQLLQEEERRRALAATGEQPDNITDNNDDENYVYLEELTHSAALNTLRHQNAIKQDQYQLPPIATEDNSKRRKMDPRLATDQELLDFIDEFKPSDIDMDSSVFQALPPEIQYEIIQDLKLKSRQTSWARLDNMVRQSKTALDFSKQQILQLKHRNEMTQRVMQMNDMASQHQSTTATAPSRIASERGKEYLLVKNENLEEGLGWRLPGMTKSTTATPVSITSAKQQQIAKSDDEADDDELAITTDSAMNTSVKKADDMVVDDDDDDDPVAKAVANNPRLAALMGDFNGTDGDYDEDSGIDQEVKPTASFPDYEYEDGDNMWEISSHGNEDFDENTPLFINNYRQHDRQREFVSQAADDYGQEGDDDDALDQILSKIYQGGPGDDYYLEQTKPTVPQQYLLTPDHSYRTPLSTIPTTEASDNDRDAELELDSDTFYQLWLSRVPDAFMYMHSFNDDYKSILKNAIADTTTVDDLEIQLKSVQKVSGKSNSNDIMQQIAYAFHQEFLNNALKWKLRLMGEQFSLEMYRQQHDQTVANATTTITNDASHTGQIAEPLILSDDDVGDDDDIQLVTSSGQQQISTAVGQLDINQEQTEKSVSTEKVEGTAQLERQFLSSTTLGTAMTNNSNVLQTDVGGDGEKKEDFVEGDHIVASTTCDDIRRQHERKEQQEVVTMGSNNNGIVQADASSGGQKDEILVDRGEPATADTFEDTKQLEEEVTELTEEAMDVGYNSDEELAADGVVQDENDEFARFISDIASRDLGSVRQELQDDVQHLNKQQTKQMGNADTITDQMVQDIQELLQLFGVPYVVSPMEAEAQCAYLLEHNLVDGVVTDDSDVFLFGGERVYKNMFSQQKYVECYLLQDIAREMHLNRKKLIQLAYFLGSDYTPGLPGIGYVSAMEILGAFASGDDDVDDKDEPLESPLQRFKVWFEDGLDKTDFEKKFRKKHKHLDIPADFPNPLVKEAYYSPMVDSSLEPFSWSPPQLDSLRLHLMKSFSWSEEKADEILIPVIREMNQRQATGTQTSISSFFDPSAGLQTSSRPTGMKRKHKSKRIQQVVKQLSKKNQKSTTDSEDNHLSDSESDDMRPRKLQPRRSTRK